MQIKGYQNTEVQIKGYQNTKVQIKGYQNTKVQIKGYQNTKVQICTSKSAISNAKVLLVQNRICKCAVGVKLCKVQKCRPTF